jgi:hypothetical protein
MLIISLTLKQRKAGQLAKLGAEESLLGPEPFCGNMEKTTRRAIDLWSQRKATMTWKYTSGETHAKRIIKNSSNKLTYDVHMLSRNQMRLIVGLLTGHCHLRKHVHGLGIYKQEPVCRKYGVGRKLPTTSFECQAIRLFR